MNETEWKTDLDERISHLIDHHTDLKRRAAKLREIRADLAEEIKSARAKMKELDADIETLCKRRRAK
jgi:chromosome segregation ATPase